MLLRKLKYFLCCLRDSIFCKTSLSQHIENFHFRCKIQLDLPVVSDERRLEVGIDVGDADPRQLSLLVDATHDGTAAADHSPANAVRLSIPKHVEYERVPFSKSSSTSLSMFRSSKKNLNIRNPILEGLFIQHLMLI